MPSSYTVSARFTLQATGENTNTWGVILNSGVFALVDFNVNGLLTKTLTTDYTLTTANGSTDEARASALTFNGSGAFTVTIPSVPKPYDVANNCTGFLTLTTGSGRSVQVRSGETVRVRCDGTNVDRVQPFYFSNQQITGVLDPTTAQAAATKNYVDTTAFNMAAGALPGQSGNAGNWLTTNGTTASWSPITLGTLGALTMANSWTATQSFVGNSTQLAAAFANFAEVETPVAFAATGTLNIYLHDQSILWYNVIAAANWTVNLTFSNSVTLDTTLAINQSIVAVVKVKQGGTPFLNNVVQVDGAGVTVLWQGGAPSGGNASGYDVYTYEIVKTAAATFTVFASLVQFK